MKMTIGKLNEEQLDGLARLCFDLAKAAFIVAFFPSTNISNNFLTTLPKMLSGLLIGLAFTYQALLILKAKEKV